ncbi:MAG: restriction endonuclease subunit S [Nitrospiraceae bacterium]|nr:restriction endonuclease subunit S [Nitrospiraceae bacterium]
MKNGWEIKTLGEVCEVINGGTPKTGVPEYWDGKHRWITPAEMGKRLSPYVGETERKISDLGLRNSSAQMMPPNSVILSSRAPIGHLVINTEPMATNQGCKGLLPGKLLQHKFLYYYLTSIVDLLNSLGTGATFKELSGGKLKEVTVPLPPLSEQQRIVRILDEAFDGIAIAKTNAEKNLQNARALFESYLQAVFTQWGAGWVRRRLGDLFDIGSSKRILESEWTSSGVPFYGGKEIVRLAKYGYVNSDAYISEEKYRDYALKYDMPQKGDILITARGTIGVGYVVKDGDRFYYKDGNIISFREKTPTNPFFVLYAFRSKQLVDQFADLTGATVKHLPIERAKNLTLKLPNFATQNSVVEHIRKMETETKRLESIYQQKLSALAELKKSLLDQAFKGEL